MLNLRQAVVLGALTVSLVTSAGVVSTASAYFHEKWEIQTCQRVQFGTGEYNDPECSWFVQPETAEYSWGWEEATSNLIIGKGELTFHAFGLANKCSVSMEGTIESLGHGDISQIVTSSCTLGTSCRPEALHLSWRTDLVEYLGAERNELVPMKNLNGEWVQAGWIATNCYTLGTIECTAPEATLGVSSRESLFMYPVVDMTYDEETEKYHCTSTSGRSDEEASISGTVTMQTAEPYAVRGIRVH